MHILEYATNTWAKQFNKHRFWHAAELLRGMNAKLFKYAGCAPADAWEVFDWSIACE